MARVIDAEEGWSGNKGLWEWQILVDRLNFEVKEGLPIIRGYKRLPITLHITTGKREQEFELVDKLTSDRSAYGALGDSVLYRALKNETDGYYRLVIYKQAQTSKLYKVPMFAYWGTTVISKHQDVFLFETKYFYAGAPHKTNLERRDPREDARRKNIDRIPSGGIDLPW